MNKKAAIIGSGISGLATAIRLVNQGYKVSVFEKNSHPGGKISQLKKSGYRFDMGPSLFTLPDEFLKLFILSGEKKEDSFDYIPLEMSCKYFYEDGMVINAYNDGDKFAEEANRKTGVPIKKIKRYLKNAEQLYIATADVFIFNSFHKISNFRKKAFRETAKYLHKLKFFSTMHGVNRRSFKNKHLVQLFDRYATYVGSNPYKAPGTLTVIAHLENNIGAFFPRRGMYDIVESATRLAKKLGVEFHFNQPVSEVMVDQKLATGIKVNNEILPFDVVVSAIDIHQVFGKLIPALKPPFQLKRNALSSSALIFYWGIKKTFPELQLHNILFSGEYKTEFDYIFNKKMVYHDPTVYIFISAKEVPSDAPADSENWFVMINVPENTGQDWDAIIKDTRKNIIHKINRILKTDIEQYIETEVANDPRSIEKNTSSYRGALYGINSNSIFSAFLRYPNFSHKVKNLYFTGGSVHPGGGIPMCLASAKIVAEEIAEKEMKK